jgi:hypothetical protein
MVSHSNAIRLWAELKLPSLPLVGHDGAHLRERSRKLAESEMDHIFCDIQDAFAICAEELIRLKYKSIESKEGQV